MSCHNNSKQNELEFMNFKMQRLRKSRKAAAVNLNNLKNGLNKNEQHKKKSWKKESTPYRIECVGQFFAAAAE